jgi:UrcA family protein
MTTPNAASPVRLALPRITMAMLICAGVSAVGVGAASAATSEGDVPAVTLKYDPMSLTTDRGARVLYKRLKNAAIQVCPEYASTGPFISAAVQQCRDQALARAVLKINDPRLVAVHQASAKNG